jgi:acyl-CoA thioesterase YciA
MIQASEHSLENMTTASLHAPDRAPIIRTTTTEADANPGGDIFGGWLLGQMDVAGGVHAYAYAQTRVVTVGIEAMSFHQPVFVGEEVSFYTEIEKIGTTSITVKIEAWAKRKSDGRDVHVTEGLFTYVSIDENRQPKPINKAAHKGNKDEI